MRADRAQPQASYPIEATITVRAATADDLPKLEWYGQYAHLRQIMRRTLHEQARGGRFMLLAEFNHFPIGTISAHVRRSELLHPGRKRVYFYSLRVMDMFQGHGVGSFLLRSAEACAQDLGCVSASIAAAKDNLAACKLYQRRGYHIIGEDPGEWSYLDHLGKLRQVNEPCWILEKALPSS